MDDGGGKPSCCSSSWFILSSSIGTCANHLASQCAARRSGRAVLLRKDALRSSKIRPDRRVCGCGSARAGAHPARGPRGLRPPRCLANRDPSRRSQRSGCSRRTADVGLAGLAVHEGVDRVHRHAPVSLWRLVAITLWSRCSWLRAARPWNGAKKTGAVAAASFRVIPETAETAETDLRDSGKDQAGGGHGVLMQARARRAERTISRASISPCHRGQPRAADRGQPTSPWRCCRAPQHPLGWGRQMPGPAGVARCPAVARGRRRGSS